MTTKQPRPYTDPDYAISEAIADLCTIENPNPSRAEAEAHIEKAQAAWVDEQRHVEIVEAARQGAAAAAGPAPVAVSIPEAARLLSMSENHFRQRVLPDLRAVGGARPRIAVADLHAWADDQKALGSGARAGSGPSAFESTASKSSIRPVSKRRRKPSDRAKQLLERASRSMQRRSKASDRSDK